MNRIVFLVIGCLLHPIIAQWQCTSDDQCSDVTGSVCLSGRCACAPNTQLALGGTHCVSLAPYHTSVCVEDHQCSGLFASFECRKQNETDAEGECRCQPGFHYFHGRCWRTVPYGAPCSQNEECLDVPVDPYSLSCDGVCVCSEGYYERQRGECRKIGYAVGDGCVLDEDCQFANGVCDIESLRCIDSTAPIPVAPAETDTAVRMTAVNVTVDSVTGLTAVRSYGVMCDSLTPCSDGLVCSTYGSCICPLGYYEQNGVCYAELGSPSTEEQCIGLLAEVINGVCTCPANFFYEENMRDCIKVTRRITDSCVSDENCHTFGVASFCGEPVDPWQFRFCDCDSDRSQWDPARSMCRLFAGIGEECVTDSDCLAGDLEIQCIANVCTCPEGLVASDGLCLTTGLALGDSCQASVECTATPNTVCLNGGCSCDPTSYQELDGYCAPIIGGSCVEDSECVISNTICVNETRTCQCDVGLLAYDNDCYNVSTGYQAHCSVNLQCVAILGEDSECVDNVCACADGHHHRDGHCWPVTGLFESCSRTSQCYHPTSSARTVCRNSICQCDFDYPYSEELGTCVNTSSAANILSNAGVLIIALIFSYNLH